MSLWTWQPNENSPTRRIDGAAWLKAISSWSGSSRVIPKQYESDRQLGVAAGEAEGTALMLLRGTVPPTIAAGRCSAISTS